MASAKAHIIIWVHGTSPEHLLPRPFAKRLHVSRYNLCTSPVGLHHVTSLDTITHHYNIGQQLAQSTSFPADAIYFFGWSGKLSVKARKEASAQLYDQIKKVIEMHTSKEGYEPSITIISHSHGGNVALHLADLYLETDTQIEIEQCILLACPVQETTAHLVRSPLFKKIYSIHSHIDMVQRLDPQGIFHIKNAIRESFKMRSLSPIKQIYRSPIPLFSQRHFIPDKKVVQIAVTWSATGPQYKKEDDFLTRFPYLTKPLLSYLDQGMRGLYHIEFILPPFVRKLPYLIQQIEQMADAQKEEDPSAAEITIEL